MTAAVTAAVDSVMKGRFDHFVKQQEQATMTSDQDHSMMSSASEITTSGSLHTARLTIGNGQSEEGDSSVLDDVVPVTSSDKGLSVQVSTNYLLMLLVHLLVLTDATSAFACTLAVHGLADLLVKCYYWISVE